MIYHKNLNNNNSTEPRDVTSKIIHIYAHTSLRTIRFHNVYKKPVCIHIYIHLLMSLPKTRKIRPKFPPTTYSITTVRAHILLSFASRAAYRIRSVLLSEYFLPLRSIVFLFYTWDASSSNVCTQYTQTEYLIDFPLYTLSLLYIIK